LISNALLRPFHSQQTLGPLRQGAKLQEPISHTEMGCQLSCGDTLLGPRPSELALRPGVPVHPQEAVSNRGGKTGALGCCASTEPSLALRSPDPVTVSILPLLTHLACDKSICRKPIRRMSKTIQRSVSRNLWVLGAGCHW
jgi:hypothetical protein